MLRVANPSLTPCYVIVASELHSITDYNHMRPVNYYKMDSS